MHDNLFIHSECTGWELVFHIRRQTYITFKYRYFRCFLKDLIPSSISLDSMSDRDKALGSVLWEDLPLVLLTHSEWEAVEAPSANSKEGTLHQWGNKKPKGRLPKPQHYFILEQLARTAGVLMPQRPGAERPKHCSQLEKDPGLQLSPPQLICRNQREGKGIFLSSVIGKNM